MYVSHAMMDVSLKDVWCIVRSRKCMLSHPSFMCVVSLTRVLLVNKELFQV